MFGFVSKKKLLAAMEELKQSGKKENHGVHYPPENQSQEILNAVYSGYECGHDNFYNGLKARLKL